MANAKPLPYWLDGGTETCSLCELPYVLQQEYRCEACDRPVCEHCIVVVATGEVFCHACPPDAEEG